MIGHSDFESSTSAPRSAAVNKPEACHGRSDAVAWWNGFAGAASRASFC